MEVWEADEIIAKFMNEYVKYCPSCGRDNYPIVYSDSLDALVPVWNKICSFDYSFISSQVGYSCTISDVERIISRGAGKTMAEAGAIATAKYLKELS